LIKVEEMQEAGYEPVEAVRAELRTRLAREEARRLAEAKAQAVYDAMVAAGRMENGGAGSRTGATGNAFHRAGEVEGIENSAAFMRTAFALQDGEVSRPTLIGNQYVVEKPLERKASHIPPFEEVKDAVRDALVREQSQALARQKAHEWLTEVQAGQSIEQLARHSTLKQSRPAYFPRKWSHPEIGPSAGSSSGEVFRMRVGERDSGRPFRATGCRSPHGTQGIRCRRL
jgi:hypothetical protein